MREVLVALGVDFCIGILAGLLILIWLIAEAYFCKNNHKDS